MSRYRLAYIGLTAALVAVIAGAIALSRSGEDMKLPPPLVAVSPEPGGAAIRQATIRVDTEPGYAIELVVDGEGVDPAEIVAIEGIGLFEWDPATSFAFDEWGPGTHTVRVTWDTLTGLPDTGQYSWSFRIQ